MIGRIVRIIILMFVVSITAQFTQCQASFDNWTSSTFGLVGGQECPPYNLRERQECLSYNAYLDKNVCKIHQIEVSNDEK
jgi:hypothetical protein